MLLIKDFKDKVAVITGAGSGIGFAIAERCVKEGMKVVLAEVNPKRLRIAEKKLLKTGGTVLSVITDVSKPEDVEMLAKKTLDNFGSVHLLFNNAGVANPKYGWNYTIKDWQWQLGVNLFGVAYGISVFLPIMLKQGFESLIINTASIEGLLFGSGIGGAVYGVSKHGVVSLSETLKYELEQTGAKVKVAVLCPGWVSTRIFTSSYTRPEEFKNDPEREVEDSKINDTAGILIDGLEKKHKPITSQAAADLVFEAIIEERFYIFTHKDQEFKNRIKDRMEGILKAFDQ